MLHRPPTSSTFQTFSSLWVEMYCSAAVSLLLLLCSLLDATNAALPYSSCHSLPPNVQVDVTLQASGKSGKAKEAHHQRDQAAEVGDGMEEGFLLVLTAATSHRHWWESGTSVRRQYTKSVGVVPILVAGAEALRGGLGFWHCETLGGLCVVIRRLPPARIWGRMP